MGLRNCVGSRVVFILMVVAGICGVAGATSPVASGIHTVPIPNFSGGGGPGLSVGGYPEVEEYDVIWTGLIGGIPPVGNAEIFYFDGATTTQLTSTTAPPGTLGNWSPFISSLNRVPYVGDMGATIQVFFHDIGAGSTIQLTTAGARYDMVVRDFYDHSQFPRVVWESMDQWLGGPFPPTWIDVDFWDGAQIIALKPRLFNHGPRVGQYNVVWQSAFAVSGPYDVFLYNTGSKTTVQMTSSAGGWSWRDPQLSEPYLVWWGNNGASTQITLCDLSKGTSYRHAVASSSSLKWPRLCNAQRHVAWAWSDDIEPYDNVYHHDHNPPFPVTTKIFPTQPSHFRGRVDFIDASYPFVAFSVRPPFPGPMDHFEVYVYDFVKRSPAVLVGMGQSSSPVFVRVSKKWFPPYGDLPVVVWETNLGNTVGPAFMATRPICNPVPKADCNRDCTVDGLDFAIISNQWGQSGLGLCDPHPDGTVNFLDLAVLFSEWLDCNIQPPIFSGRGVIF